MNQGDIFSVNSRMFLRYHKCHFSCNPLNPQRPIHYLFNKIIVKLFPVGPCRSLRVKVTPFEYYFVNFHLDRWFLSKIFFYDISKTSHSSIKNGSRLQSKCNLCNKNISLMFCNKVLLVEKIWLEIKKSHKVKKKITNYFSTRLSAVFRLLLKFYMNNGPIYII